MRRTIITFLLWGASAFAQPTSFQVFPQLHTIGSLTEYVVKICNAGDQPLNVYAMQAWSAASEVGVTFANYSTIQGEQLRVQGMSWQRKTLLGFEIAGIVFTIADSAGVWKIGSDKMQARWKVAVPIATTLIQAGTSWVKQQADPTVMPDPAKLMPPMFQVPGKGCVDYLMYGTARAVSP